jgi:hypothetical protein
LSNKTAPVSDLIWLSNYDSNGDVVQPLVSLNLDPSSVPEPSSLVLAGTGLAISTLALLHRRHQRSAGAKVG